jgi:hypothetical protein
MYVEVIGSLAMTISISLYAVNLRFTLIVGTILREFPLGYAVPTLPVHSERIHGPPISVLFPL